jgi:anti-sigma regulatory factor (Ser/Thr protein kinase)
VPRRARTANQRSNVRLIAQATAPRAARDFLAMKCREWDACRFLEPASLVVSELVTNAVRHAGTDIRLDLELAGAALTVAVHDSGTGVPYVVPPERRLLGGRGLAMVERVAESWGVAADEDGKSVWCRIRVEAPPQPSESF